MATAKKSRKSSSKKKKVVEPPPPSSSSSSDSESGSEEKDQGSDDMKLTLEALDAMSDDSDDNDEDEDMEEKDNEEADGIGDGETEAAALRKMISDGKFDGLLKNAKKNKKDTTKDEKMIGNGSDDESEEDEEKDDESGVYETANVDDGEYEEIEQNEEHQDKEEEADEERYWMSDPATKVNESEDDDSSSSDSDSDEKETQQTTTKKKTSANIALETALQMANRNLPWAESFTIVSPTPLPFNPSSTSDGNKKRKLNAYTEEEDDEDEEEEYVDVHDDLKREVAFYDNALESVTLAREQCEGVGIPFTRPDDFFAEMVKSDDHMAKIKDRLIFETKKMEAVERRKSNKEQTVMAKERHAFRIAEKSKQKKEHMSALNDWKKNTERNRSNMGGKVNDWQDDEDQLRGMSGKKRMNANKKYGFGDKRGGRFKQNDKRTLNDMSDFRPKGGFGGIGQKSSGGGKGKKRPGKRARDSKR